MNINSPVATLLDEASDYVGQMSGLAVTSSDVVRLLDRDLATTDESDWWYSPRTWLHDPPQHWVRIRAEDLESLVVRLLYAVGALPSPWNQMQLLVKFASEHPQFVENIPPASDEDEFPFPVPPWTRFYWFVNSVREVDGLPSELAGVINDFKRRSIIEVMFRTERLSWDGTVPLAHLFDMPDFGSAVQANGESPPLIDQRFIDYLHAQPEDLSAMHWRQFELLIGEFFRREGYDVYVTTPAADGGVDIRAIRENDVLGPELILVQAKRHRDDRKVGVEVVKALWSDVDEAGATRGVIATTSTLAPGARAYCQARRYRLTPAERPMVEKWLKAFATHPR